MLRTRITEKFGIKYPIMSAPMAMHSDGRLAAAVSNVGALGTFGGISTGGPDWLRAEIRSAREQTEAAFGVGFITHLLPMFSSLLDVVIEEKVPVVAFSFADPGPYAAKAKAAGATVVCQVQSMKHAREAVAAGADVLVAQGNEAGGHTGTMNLLPLLVNLLEAHPDIPIMASGGITNGRALAAVLTAGADGAWLGTALLATPECASVSSDYKQAIVDSNGEDTVYTSVVDIIQAKVMGIPDWPKGIAERVRRDALIDRWSGRESELREAPDAAIAEYTESRDRGEALVLMGQGAASVTAIRPAAEVIASICGEAEGILRERPRQLLS